MRKIFLLMVLFLFFNAADVLGANELIAAANVSEYSVTVNKVELYNSTTGQWVTVADTPTTLNIASASAGAVVGNMVSGVILPDGTYTQMRWTVSSTFTIEARTSVNKCTSGSTNFGGVSSHTVATTIACGTELPVNTVIDFSQPGTPPPGTTGTATTLSGTENISPSIIIGPGSTPRGTSISFDVHEVLQYCDGTTVAVPYCNNTGGTDYVLPGLPDISVAFE